MTTKQAIKHFGSKAEVARALGITIEAVIQWDKHPPMLRQFQLEKLTNGELKVDG